MLHFVDRAFRPLLALKRAAGDADNDVAHIRCLELFARQGERVLTVNLTEQLCQRLLHYISLTIAADELSSAQPRHVIERLIDHEQHPALRQIEAEVAQIEAQVAQIPEPVAEPPLREPCPMSRVRPHDDGVIVVRPPKLSHRFPKPPSL